MTTVYVALGYFTARLLIAWLIWRRTDAEWRADNWRILVMPFVWVCLVPAALVQLMKRRATKP